MRHPCGGRLIAATGARVDVIPLDLGQVAAGETLADHLHDAGLQVDVLVENAVFATHGDIAEATDTLPRLLEQVQVNVAAVVDLTTRFLPGMVARGRGAVINTASTVAFQPIPHVAVYGATKAFVLSFTEALWAETRGTGVRVTGVAPGATETGFFDVVGAEEGSFGRRRTPEQVVATALRGLDRRRPTVVDGTANRLLTQAPRVLPRRTVLSLAERATRRRHRGGDRPTTSTAPVTAMVVPSTASPVRGSPDTSAGRTSTPLPGAALMVANCRPTTPDDDAAHTPRRRSARSSAGSGEVTC